MELSGVIVRGSWVSGTNVTGLSVIVVLTSDLSVVEKEFKLELQRQRLLERCVNLLVSDRL